MDIEQEASKVDMFRTVVVAPNGRQWEVGLRLIPERQGIGFRERFLRRRRKRSNANTRWHDFFDIPMLDGLDDIVMIALLVAGVLLLVFVGWPLLLLLVDFIWLVLVLLGALISFGLLGRPATVAAKSDTGELRTWKARGLIGALRLKKEVTIQVAQGVINGGQHAADCQ